jgi:YidC/Oxa1 family membrane protein insertase
LDFLSNAMQYVLTFFYNLTVSMGFANYGLAIILLTIALKFALYPLTVSQVKSMKEMAFIQPKMKELQEKYKGNPEKLNKEMADLYKNHKINPLAGCLPLLVQMPFLIAIFYAIRDYQYVGEPSFLWLTSLAVADPTYVLPVLSAATTYLQTKLFTAPEQQEQQKMMLIFMPIFILWISLSFPAGLVLYWVVGNVVQIIQQYYLYKKPLVTQGEA